MASFPGFDSPAYGQIGGALPWNAGGSGASALAANTPEGVAAGYQQAYNSSLAMNQSNYNNILSGYQNVLAQQTTAQQAIQAGYSGLYNQVMGQVQNMYSGQSDTINRNMAQLQGKSDQQLIDRGLGNTTIQQSVNTGIGGETAYQQSLLTGQEAGTMAQYMSQLGLAGLGNQQQGLNNITGQANRQLDWMNSVNAGYPNAGMYGALAQQAGMNQANRQNPMGQYGGGSFGGAGPKVGYVPGPTPMYGGGAGGQQGGIGGGGSWLMDQYQTPAALDQAGVAAGGAGGGLSMLGGSMGGYGDATSAGGGLSMLGGSMGGGIPYGATGAMDQYASAPQDVYSDPYGGGGDF